MQSSNQARRSNTLLTVQNGQKSLPIDVTFDTEFADRMARLESYNKHHYRPNTYMHKWWARRCGSTFRLILKHLVPDAEQRGYYVAGGLTGKVILDPMMGGGTTLHEAIRLGASVVGADLDPIPVLQARASLSDLPLATLERAFQHFYRTLQAELSAYYETTCPKCLTQVSMRFMLYGRRRNCRCGPVIMVDSLVLRYENGEPCIRLCPACHSVLSGDAVCTCRGRAGKPRLVIKQTLACPDCGTTYQDDLQQPFYTRYEPLVVVGDCPHDGLFFTSPSPADLRLIEAADACRSTLSFDDEDVFAVQKGPKSRDLLNHGIFNYRDLFSSRQLLYLSCASKVLPQFEELARLNLALLVSTSLEFNSMLCGYKGVRRGQRPGAIRHTFSYHAYSFPYTALENNLLHRGRASGTLQKLFHDRIRRARRWARQPRERNLNADQPRFVQVKGEIDLGLEVEQAAALTEGDRRFFLHQGSARNLPLPDNSVDFVITDPPYYDNVQYPDLAAFFRVWLKYLIGDKAAAPQEWTYDYSQAALDISGNGNEQYLLVLSEIMQECRRVLKEDGRLIFTFHHWKPKGWAALTIALQRAGFQLVNYYVVHAENPISVHIANLRALTHDAILVLAPQTAKATRWQQPGKIDKDDSALFCQDCASLLGWMLHVDLEEWQIREMWRHALTGG